MNNYKQKPVYLPLQCYSQSLDLRGAFFFNLENQGIPALRQKAVESRTSFLTILQNGRIISIIKSTCF